MTCDLARHTSDNDEDCGHLFQFVIQRKAQADCERDRSEDCSWAFYPGDVSGIMVRIWGVLQTMAGIMVRIWDILQTMAGVGSLIDRGVGEAPGGSSGS